MSKNLVIVESPSKAKTIEKFLGKDFKVIASYGHVRDLPKSELGVDVEKNFKPRYIIPAKATKRVNSIKKEIEKSNEIYLATDLDREGEAIAWHLASFVEKEKEPKRVVYTEVTKDAVLSAFNKPRKIDSDLVDAQQGRRILDRLVGYNLSPLLWKKVRRGLSAGRVQSVAVNLIVEREREREKFKQEEYWQVEASLSKKNENNLFLAKLSQKDGKKLDKLAIKSKDESEAILKEVKTAKWLVDNISEKEQLRQPKPPYITSTLQQDASNLLNFSAKKTMIVAQQLYEGVEIGNKGSVGLITYMRTDSLNMARGFLTEVQEYIAEIFGKSYKKDGGRFFRSKSKTAQEAHEAIRPTYIENEPDKIKEFLTADQYKLYKLIFKRALSSQMAEARVKNTKVEINAGKYGFSANGQVILFDGFLKVSSSQAKEQNLPELLENEELFCHKINPIQSFTQPLARFTEATLVKALEEDGIGRPSTYAPTMGTIVSRGYVAKEGKYFVPQEIGFIVNDLLVKHFPEIVNAEFTAQIEEDLDKIAQGNMDWIDVMREFYEPFSKDLENKHEEIEKHKFPEKVTDIKCEKCGKNMVEKVGRFGKFLACSGFPDCKNTKQVKSEIGIKCPKCGGEIIERRTRKGKVFYGCSNYPKCDYASWYRPTGEKCPKCQELLIQKNKKIACSSCDFTKDE